MATYILVDTANTFFRARHVVRGDIDTKVGMAMHITLSGVKKAWRDFNADHVVFCLEGRSWRKDFYEPYKRNRQVARDKMTVTESEEDKVFWEIFDEFKDFVTEKTNCTVMRHPQLEADDLIAGWVQAHPNDNHVIPVVAFSVLVCKCFNKTYFVLSTFLTYTRVSTKHIVTSVATHTLLKQHKCRIGCRLSFFSFLINYWL